MKWSSAHRRFDPIEAQWFEVLKLWHGLLATPGKAEPAEWITAR